MDIFLFIALFVMTILHVVEITRMQDLKHELDYCESQLGYLRDDLIHVHFEMERLQDDGK